MYHLDVRTLGMVAMMTSLLFAAGLLLVYKTVARDQSVYFWVLGASAGVPGFALYALRGFIPDLLSIVAANTFLIAGAIWLFAGSRKLLLGQDGPRWHWVVLAISAALLCGFTYLVPSLWARTYSISAALAVLFFHSALLFLRRREGADRTVLAFIGAAYLANALFMGARLVVMPFMTSDDQDVMASANPVYTLALVFVIGLDIVLGIGLPLLISGRQQRQLIENEARLRSIVQNSSDAIFVRDAAGQGPDGLQPLLLARFLRAGIYTMPEFLEYRYNPAARAIMTVLTVVTGRPGQLGQLESVRSARTKRLPVRVPR